MNLIKNVDGPWEMAKQRIRQDLDTIQREVNQLRGMIVAPTTEDVLPATITQGGRVITYGGKGLTSVAISYGLKGSGTPASPLYVLNPVNIVSGIITLADINNNNTILLVDAVSNRVHIPLWIAFHAIQVGAFATSRALIVKYNSATGPTLATTSNIAVGGGSNHSHDFTVPVNTAFLDATLDPAGKSIVGTFGGTSTGSPTYTCTWTFAYMTVDI